MKLQLTNVSQDSVTIGDLGIILGKGESTYIDFLPEVSIIESSDLNIVMTSGLIAAHIESAEYNYTDFIASFNRLTEAKHEILNTFSHNLSQTNHMTTTKDTSGRTQFITYWTDSSLTLKEREDEIVRDAVGKSAQIISRQYNDLGAVIYTETQSLNRETSGKVSSVTTVKS